MTEAQKELQKLRWLLARANIPKVPFPNLSDCCKRLLLRLEEVGVGEDHTVEEEEEAIPVRKEEEVGLRRRLARWGFHHGLRSYQDFFLEYC